MVNAELLQHCDNNQLLWFVYGEINSLYIDAVRLRVSSEFGFIVWGYSVYRRSPGFRTIGSSLKHLRLRHPICELYTDQTTAINRFMIGSGTIKTFEELRVEHTPRLTFLKKEKVRHNLTVVI